MERVNRDAPDADLQSLNKLLTRLIVPVEVDSSRRVSCRECHRELAAGHNVQRQTLIPHDLQNRGIGERLG